MKFSNSLLVLLGVMLLLALGSCKHDSLIGPGDVTPTDTTIIGKVCSPDTAYFQNQVLPVLVSRCATSGCHDAGSHKEGIVLTSYANAKKLVVSGNASKSELYKVLFASGEDLMPPPPLEPLTTDQKNLIKKWIDQGAKDNACDDYAGGCNLDNITFSKTVLPLIVNKCKGCHSGSNPSGKLALTTYNEIKAVALNGKLYGSVARLAGYSPMPVGAKLPDCEVSKIKGWVDAGAPNN